MKARSPNTRVPEINLFVRQPRPTEPTTSRRRIVEGFLFVLVIAIWVGVGVFIATLFGWHPDLGP
jgi:hypothetical protein